MKNKPTLFYSLLLFLAMLPFVSSASHDKGGFISYQHLSGNTYRVTFTFFRDCSGITVPASVNINYASVSCGLNGTALANQISVVNSTNICPSLASQTTCNGGTYIGEEMYTYQTDITLPGECSDWIFSYEDCCLPGSVTNVAQNGMHFRVTLDNLNYQDNSSPILTSPSISVVCAGVTSTYNFGAVDPDGDSLAYELTAALDAGGVSMTYQPGYSPTNPIQSAPALTVDPVTGTLTFSPTMIEACVVAVLIKEYRNGVLIAQAIRQLIVTTSTCSNIQPAMGSISNVTGGIQTGPDEITVCPNTPISFQITGSDADLAQILQMTAVSSYPGATFNQTGINPVTGTFSWTPTIGFIGTNIVLFVVEDNNCPYLGRQFKTVTVKVRQTTYAGPDINYCSAQGPINLNVVGGNNFTWTVLSGDPVMSCTNCPNPQVSPTVTTTYRVLSDLSTCNNADTITVNVVPDFTFTMDQTATVCTPYNSSTPLNITATPTPAGSYTYSWDDLGSNWSGNTSSVSYPVSQNTNVAVVVSSSAGCVLRDTISISSVVYDPNPTWSLTSSATTLCSPGSVDLGANASYGAQCDQYNASSITYQPIVGSGTTLALSDDQVSAALPIGFDFNFYCNTYSNVYVSSNGFLTFNNDLNSGCCSGQNIPNASTPNNVIAATWTDLYPPGTGNVNYFTTGTAPNRQFIVNYSNVPFCCDATPTVNVQVILFETSNAIEVHANYINGASRIITIGVENIDGTMAVAAPGRNASSFTATNEAWRFAYLANEPYLITWEAPAGTSIGTGNPLTVNPSTTTTYYATISDVTGTCPGTTQNITVTVDNIAPVADIVSLSDINSACQVTSLTAPTATDNCAGSVTGVPNVSLPISGSTVVTWTYTDALGNSSSQTQNVNINDAIAPTPDQVSLADVNSTCQVTSLTAPTATDNCGGLVTVTNNAVLPISNQGTTMITWTYTDGNGNSTTQNQNVVINDNIAPVADVATLTDVTAECSVTALTAPTATDNCAGSIIGTHNATLPITNQGNTLVTWTYNDGNGNTTTQTQNVVIADVTPPVPNSMSLADITNECSVSTLTAPTATDNCSGTITGTHNATLPITTQGTTVVTWTYNDGNGNISTQTQNVVIDDNTPPVPDMASLSDVNNQCEVTSLTAPTATDNCSAMVTVTNNATFPITSTSVVTWTYNDGNGNTSTQTQNIIIDDNTAPVPNMTTLPDVVAECEVTSLTAPTATDNCSGVVTGTHSVTLPITGQGTTIVTWTFVDNDGNMSTQQQNVVIDDISQPVIGALPVHNGNCENPLTAPTATDNCSGSIIGTTSDPLVYTTLGNYTVNWSFDDGNGNILVAQQQVSVTGSTTYATVNGAFCGSYTAPSGTVYTSTGTYTDVIPNASGCDSIITLNLDLSPAPVSYMTAQFCHEYTVPSGTTTYYTSGVYNDTLQTVDGCDSILVIDLTIYTVDNSVTLNGFTMTANANNATYSWIDCATGIQVPGQTNQSFTAVYNGSYAVVVYQNMCYDTSACTTINSLSLPDKEEYETIQIYPNPTTGIFNVVAAYAFSDETARISDLNGKLIRSIDLNGVENKVNISNLENGIYLLEVRNMKYRIVKND